MAKLKENDKKFKVIELDFEEMASIGFGWICDRCGKEHKGTGYYVAVLNRWFCPPCYEAWYKNAINYAESNPNSPDAQVERKNFMYVCNLLGARL